MVDVRYKWESGAHDKSKLKQREWNIRSKTEIGNDPLQAAAFQLFKFAALYLRNRHISLVTVRNNMSGDFMHK